MAETFQRVKANRLKANDLSRKGSIDEPIKELIEFINSEEDYFTTSSCSGRAVVFCQEKPTERKQGCKWLFVSHNEINSDELIKSLVPESGDLVFKFEPFILHVQCRTVIKAQLLYKAAVDSGFRNSGMSISGKGKIIVAVRSSLALEVPLSNNGKLLVNNEYLQYLVEKANEKFEENKLKTERFFSVLKKTISSTAEPQKSSLENG